MLHMNKFGSDAWCLHRSIQNMVRAIDLHDLGYYTGHAERDAQQLGCRMGIAFQENKGLQLVHEVAREKRKELRTKQYAREDRVYG